MKGWIEREKAGTTEGNLQGLAKILECIAGNNEVLVQREES